MSGHRRLLAIFAVLMLAAPVRGQCPCDCDDDGAVAINEIIASLAVALGDLPVAACPGAPHCVDEPCILITGLIDCIDAALGGCTPRFRIDGCVTHFSGCGGSMEFGVVTAQPLGRSAQVDLGYFSFAAVPPGEYTLTYAPACNPAGCTRPVMVTVVDDDAYAAFHRYAEPAATAANGAAGGVPVATRVSTASSSVLCTGFER
jgi:hypothetical protein